MSLEPTPGPASLIIVLHSGSPFSEALSLFGKADATSPICSLTDSTILCLEPTMHLHRAGYWERDELDMVPTLQELWLEKEQTTWHVLQCHLGQDPVGARGGTCEASLGGSGKTPKEVMENQDCRIQRSPVHGRRVETDSLEEEHLHNIQAGTGGERFQCTERLVQRLGESNPL